MSHITRGRQPVAMIARTTGPPTHLGQQSMVAQKPPEVDRHIFTTPRTSIVYHPQTVVLRVDGGQLTLHAVEEALDQMLSASGFEHTKNWRLLVLEKDARGIDQDPFA